MFHRTRSGALTSRNGQSGLFVMMLIIVLVSFPRTAFGGRGDKAGTAAASELLIPVGARAVAMGGSSLSSISGIEAIYWNPAGLSRSTTRLSAMVSHMSYLADVSVDYFAVSTTVGDAGRFGIAVKSLSFGDVKVTTEDQPDGTGEITSPTYLTVGGTFARQLTDRISIGVTSNFVFERLGRVSATDFAFNAGVQYAGLGGMEGLSVGVVIKNVGPSLRYGGTGLIRTAQVNDATQQNVTVRIQAAASELPSTIEIGLGYKVALTEEGHLDVSSTFQNNNFSEDEYKIGAEYSYDGTLFLRGGYSFASEDQGGEYIYGPTVGGGLRTIVGNTEISVDYAYRSVKYFSGNHLFCIGLGF